jgi:hypothetical protein
METDKWTAPNLQQAIALVAAAIGFVGWLLVAFVAGMAIESWWRAFSEERADALLKPMAGYAPRSSIHKADAALAGGRPAPQRILVLAVEIKACPYSKL